VHRVVTSRNQVTSWRQAWPPVGHGPPSRVRDGQGCGVCGRGGGWRDRICEQAGAWQAAERTFRWLAGADYYLFSVPMWNHGIPYILKQFIDVVSQPGMVFTFDAEHGYTGLLTGKRAVVVYTSAVYGAGRPAAFGSDFQAPYFNDWLAWAGITDTTEIHFRPDLATADADASRQAAHAAAREAAKKF
jgi:FMN-dependent NADH-azoreductase